MVRILNESKARELFCAILMDSYISDSLQLTEDIEDRAVGRWDWKLYNMLTEVLDNYRDLRATQRTSKEIAELINYAFAWSSTPEGYNYWRDVYMVLEKGGSSKEPKFKEMLF